MLIRLQTTTHRVAVETWELDVPDELVEDVLRDPENVMRYIALDAEINVRPGVAVEEVTSRTFDSAEPVEPVGGGRHRAEA